MQISTVFIKINAKLRYLIFVFKSRIKLESKNYKENYMAEGNRMNIDNVKVEFKVRRVYESQIHTAGVKQYIQ